MRTIKKINKIKLKMLVRKYPELTDDQILNLTPDEWQNWEGAYTEMINLINQYRIEIEEEDADA